MAPPQTIATTGTTDQPDTATIPSPAARRFAAAIAYQADPRDAANWPADLLWSADAYWRDWASREQRPYPRWCLILRDLRTAGNRKKITRCSTRVIRTRRHRRKRLQRGRRDLRLLRIIAECVHDEALCRLCRIVVHQLPVHVKPRRPKPQPAGANTLRIISFLAFIAWA